MEGAQGVEHLHLAVQKVGVFETGLPPHFAPMCSRRERPVAPAHMRAPRPLAMQVGSTCFVYKPAGQL